MRECAICHFWVELDDVVVLIGAQRCVCLLCYERITTERTTRVPQPVVRDVRQAAADVG
jgi:hypothetical protein